MTAKESILKGLSSEQGLAASHGKGPAMVIAGPGSGKTRVITSRVRMLTEAGGVDPGRILVITFTKAAATEMRQRYIRETGVERSKVHFQTFHSFFFSVLRRAYGYTAREVLQEDERYALLRELSKDMAAEREDEKEFLQQISEEISYVKNEGLDPAMYYPASCPKEGFLKLFHSYEERVRGANRLDYDDMVLLTKELFEAREDILSAYRKSFQYLLIDEFQDINRLPYEILCLLLGEEKNLFIVGDDDQSIYRFRGAKPELMLSFPKNFPEAKIYLLSTNYRSTEAIVKTSLRLIENNKERFSKELHAHTKGGELPKIWCLKSQKEEGLFLVHKAREILRKEGSLPYGRMAVLYRTHIEGAPIAEELLAYQIPFTMKDRIPNIYDHWITKDVMSYFALAEGSRRREHFLRIMNRPLRYWKRESLGGADISYGSLMFYYEKQPWMQERIARFFTDLSILQRLKPYPAMRYLRETVGYDEFLAGYAEERGIEKESLFETLDQLEETTVGMESLEEWRRKQDAFREKLKENISSSETEDGVSLMSLHRAKGLEFDTVILLHLNEKLIPYQKAVLPEDIEEERRLLYVGLTRAKKELHLTVLEERYRKQQERSRFLKELLTE